MSEAARSGESKVAARKAWITEGALRQTSSSFSSDVRSPHPLIANEHPHSLARSARSDFGKNSQELLQKMLKMEEKSRASSLDT